MSDEYSNKRLSKFVYLCRECEIIHFSPNFMPPIIVEKCPLKNSSELKEHHDKVIDQLEKKEYLNV